MSRSIKGLMVKDFQLMRSQMKFYFIVMMLWGVVMASSLNMVFFCGVQRADMFFPAGQYIQL